MWLRVSAVRTSRVKRVVIAASAAAVTSVILPASAGHAEPSIGEVQQRLDGLYHQAESAQERLNTLNVRLDDTRERLTTLRSDLSQRRRHYAKVSDMVAGMAAEEAQSVESQLGLTQQFLLAQDPLDLLNRMGAHAALSSKKGETLNRLTTASRLLQQRQSQVSAALDQVSADQQQAAKEDETVDAKVAEAKDLLDNLEAERRARLREAREREAARQAALAREARAEAAQQARQQASQTVSRSAPRVQTPNVSGGAAQAVSFAMDQVGDAYVYGAAGPDAFDCSGLTMQAWSRAGVSLPHSSSAQYSSGPHVSTSDLQPGDLVFYYSPISHVAMYIGNGRIVQAANPSDGVNVASVSSMPISGAVRPG
jgi:cell wall-associated NlpC family hydrolase